MNNFKAPHISKSIVKQVLASSAVAAALLVAGGNAVNADTTSANVTNPTPTTQTTDNQASQAKAATITVNFKDGDKVVKTIKVDVKDVNNADDLNQANDSIKSQLPDNYKLADGATVNANATDTNMDVAVTSTTPAKTDTNKATDNDKQKGSIYHLTPAEMQAAKESAKKDGVTVNEDGVAYDGNTDGMPNPYAPKTDITTGTPAKTDTSKVADNDKQKGSIYHLTPVEMQVAKAEMQAAKEAAKAEMQAAKEADKKDATAPKQSTDSKTSAKTTSKTDTSKVADNDKQKGSIYHLTPAEMQAAKESAKKDGVTVNEDGVAYDGNVDGMPNPYAPKTDITTGTPAKGANVTPDGQILTQVDPLAPISGDDSSNIPSSIDLSATKDMPWNDTMSALNNPNGNPYNTDLNANSDTTGNQNNSALPDTGQNTKNSGVIAAIGAGLVAIAGLFGLARSRKTVK